MKSIICSMFHFWWIKLLGRVEFRTRWLNYPMGQRLRLSWCIFHIKLLMRVNIPKDGLTNEHVPSVSRKPPRVCRSLSGWAALRSVPRRRQALTLSLSPSSVCPQIYSRGGCTAASRSECAKSPLSCSLTPPPVRSGCVEWRRERERTLFHASSVPGFRITDRQIHGPMSWTTHGNRDT